MCVVRLEFLVDDLKKDVQHRKSINPLIIKAWNNILSFLSENGNPPWFSDGCMVTNMYNINDKDDLIRCITDGATAEDIHNVFVANALDDKSPFFTINSLCCPYVYTWDEISNFIMPYIEGIAYDILKSPYKPLYGDLYKQYVVPMIENQK